MAQPSIDIWYGDVQRFGHLGNPQRWINVLGTVSDAAMLVSLRYTLNDGASQPLNIGPDGLRLRGAGDFNVEIATSPLCDGENVVRLIARYRDGTEVTRTVTVHYAPNRVWPLPYEADLRNVDAISDAVQIVEGRWLRTGDGVRPQHPSYDRLLALGDVTWRDYQVTVTAQVHGFVEDAKGLLGGFGILLRWTGHYADGSQPSGEWRPSGAIGWYRARWEDKPTRHRCLNISDGVIEDRVITETPPLTLDPDTRYVFQCGVRSRPGGTSQYHYRVWPEGHPESLLCDLIADGREGESPRGSVLLIALYVDVTICNVIVEPLLPLPD